jgi:CheY-like chemotaxis protein
MHGGDLNVESTLGQGSTFSFTLPISQEQAAQHLVLSKSIASSAKTLRPVQNMAVQAILLVEDETNLRQLLHRSLQEAGYMVIDEQDGARALEIATGLLPHLIILDVRIPTMDGWELLDALKKNPDTASIPVLVCTVSEDEARALELGAALYLHKPFSLDELLADVEELIPPVVQHQGKE